MSNHVFDTNRTPTQERDLMQYFYEKYNYVIDQLQYQMLTAQTAFDMLSFDINTPSLYVDSDFNYAVQMHPNLQPYKLVLFQHEVGRQANQKSAYSLAQYQQLLQTNPPSDNNWIIENQHHMQIVDNQNAIQYFKLITKNLTNLF